MYRLNNNNINHSTSSSSSLCDKNDADKGLTYPLLLNLEKTIWNAKKYIKLCFVHFLKIYKLFKYFPLEYFTITFFFYFFLFVIIKWNILWKLNFLNTMFLWNIFCLSDNVDPKSRKSCKLSNIFLKKVLHMY